MAPPPTSTAPAEPTVLYDYDPSRREASRLAHYQRWLREHRGRDFPDYRALWTWSVSDQEGFWQSIWTTSTSRLPPRRPARSGRARCPAHSGFPARG